MEQKRMTMDFYHRMACSRVWHPAPNETHYEAAVEATKDMAARGLPDVDPMAALKWACDLRAFYLAEGEVKSYRVDGSPRVMDPKPERVEFYRKTLRELVKSNDEATLAARGSDA